MSIFFVVASPYAPNKGNALALQILGREKPPCGRLVFASCSLDARFATVVGTVR